MLSKSEVPCRRSTWTLSRRQPWRWRSCGCHLCRPAAQVPSARRCCTSTMPATSHVGLRHCCCHPCRAGSAAVASAHCRRSSACLSTCAGSCSCNCSCCSVLQNPPPHVLVQCSCDLGPRQQHFSEAVWRGCHRYAAQDGDRASGRGRLSNAEATLPVLRPPAALSVWPELCHTTD